MAGFMHTGKEQRNASIPIRRNAGIPGAQEGCEAMDHLIVEMPFTGIIPAFIGQPMGKGFHSSRIFLLFQENIFPAILYCWVQFLHQLPDSLFQYHKLFADFLAGKPFIRHPYQGIKSRFFRFDCQGYLFFQLESLFQPGTEDSVILLFSGFLPFLHQRDP